MKKLIISLFIFVSLFTLLSFNVHAEEAGEPLPNFNEDFESYDLGKTEEILSFRDNWSNDYYTGESDGTQQLDVSWIEYEDETKSNKVLRVTNIENDGSFFFISAAKASRYKNFSVTFKVKVLDCKEEVGGWFGINCRKEIDARYNGTNGMLLTYRCYKPSEGKPYFPATYRYMPLTQLDLTPETISDYGKNATYNVFESYNVSEENNGWVEYKIDVQDTNYKMYADGKLVSDFTYDKKAINTFGYLSFNVCVCDLMMDDFNLINHDETAPDPIENDDPTIPDTTTTENKTTDGDIINNDKQTEKTNNTDTKKGCKSLVSVISILPLLGLSFVLLVLKERKK